MELPEPRRIVKFWFGCNVVTAVGEAQPHHAHVLRLTIDRDGVWSRFVRSLIPRFPQAIQSLVRKIWPAYFLPPRVFVKKLKPRWDDEFDNEKRMYARLRPLQGRLIPVFYGEVQFEGTRALVLSEVEGIVACEQPTNARLAPEEFERRVEEALRELHAFGVSYDDTKLHNIILGEHDKIMFVDLESVWEPDPGDMDYALEAYTEHFVRAYKMYLTCDPAW